MAASLASKRYLQHYCEPDLPACSFPRGHWHHVLVIPAYKESADLIQRLRSLPAGAGRILVILVLNRPDSDTDGDANKALRTACLTLPESVPQSYSSQLRALSSHIDLYLQDTEEISGPLPASQGVGLARKIGCDLAWQWMAAGMISSRWICSGDADALHPQDYFKQLDALPATTAAAIYPFVHVPGGDESCNQATALYELRLHHYRLGLEYAGSPYALHTLGSCIAVQAEHYAMVRGFPRRAGGEDFYLLNKLAKVGAIAKLGGKPIELESRLSQRAPFGTGPAVASIHAGGALPEQALFYHPHSFEALRCLLMTLPALESSSSVSELPGSLRSCGMTPELVEATCATMDHLGLDQALAHCRRQATSSAQYLSQFHQWFDGFRTLKLIHGIRDAGWPLQSLIELEGLKPCLWPEGKPSAGIDSLRTSIRRHWGWE